MKFYNPFKAHFCQFGNGEFGMRKLTPFGWKYLDTNDMQFWHGSNYGGSRFASLSAVKSVVADKLEQKRREKMKSKSWRIS